jgi:hypothetical protein
MGASSRAGRDPDSTWDDTVEHAEDVFDDEKQLEPQRHDDADLDVDPTSTEPADGAFNAFDASTWDINPTTVAWYETKQAMATTVVAAVAVVALVVSVVLLAVRGSSSANEPAPVDNPSTATSAAPHATPVTASVTPPPPPPPGPPPPPSPAPPAYVPMYTRPDGNSPRQAMPTVRVERTSIAPRPGPVIRATPAPGGGG